MEQNSTPNQLVKFLYRETSSSETLNIAQALSDDPLLFEEFEGLQQAHQQLPKVKFKPAAKTIQSILAYSKQVCLCR